MTSPLPIIRLHPNRPTGNFWVDTGLVVLLEQFGEREHEMDKKSSTQLRTTSVEDVAVEAKVQVMR
ncbi:hypothetical protein HRbin08_00899 [bacterium HR08]|nr:hypothetical protein HRbin08_00899 [bacterium HR08]